MGLTNSLPKNGEEAAAAVRRAKELAVQKDYTDKREKAAVLAALPGHPLYTLSRENAALAALIDETDAALAADEDISVLLQKIGGLSVHYAKKGDLLYPLLKVRYEVAGPSDLMWTHDDEIRDELAALIKASDRGADWEERAKAVLHRVRGMIEQEERVLFPICAVNFTDEEWRGIYRDSLDYADCLGVKGERWDEAELPAAAPAPQEGEIVMPGGHLTPSQLTAMLNTIPMELTFVDAGDINRFFNEGPKVFKRPGMAIDREVFSCHPPKIEPMVRAIIGDFRAGRRDRVPVWMEKNGRTMLVTYLAVRDREGNYLGTLEAVQDMEFAKEHFAK